MAEQLVDLGNHRLLVSQFLGDEFARALESQPLPDEPQILTTVRGQLARNPALHLLGYAVEEGAQFENLEAALATQM